MTPPTRWLAVDPGGRHLGVALSDPLGLAARPLTTLRHVSRAQDAARLVALAEEHGADGLLVGQPLDDDDAAAGPLARHAARLAEALRALTDKPVVLVDESGSSREARALLLAGGKTRRARRELEHAAAAAAILQSYLDAHPPQPPAR